MASIGAEAAHRKRQALHDFALPSALRLSKGIRTEELVAQAGSLGALEALEALQALEAHLDIQAGDAAEGDRDYPEQESCQGLTGLGLGCQTGALLRLQQIYAELSS